MHKHQMQHLCIQTQPIAHVHGMRFHTMLTVHSQQESTTIECASLRSASNTCTIQVRNKTTTSPVVYDTQFTGNPNVWKVESKDLGASYRVDIARGFCGCRDFLSTFGEYACKHLVAGRLCSEDAYTGVKQASSTRCVSTTLWDEFTDAAKQWQDTARRRREHIVARSQRTSKERGSVTRAMHTAASTPSIPPPVERAVDAKIRLVSNQAAKRGNRPKSRKEAAQRRSLRRKSNARKRRAPTEQYTELLQRLVHHFKGKRARRGAVGHAGGCSWDDTVPLARHAVRMPELISR